MEIEAKRRLRYGTNAIILTAAIIVSAALLYGILDRRHIRWDFTANREQSLSPQTQSVLKELGQPVKIIAFFRNGEDLDDVFIRRKVNDVLREYATRSSKIEYAMYNPDSQIDTAIQYGITTDGTVVFQSGPYRKDVYKSQLFDYANAPEDLPPAFKGEGEFTNAILKVTKATQIKICLLQGHGERSPQDTSTTGMSEFRNALIKNNYDVHDVSLISSPNIPKDCSLVILSGPQKPLPPVEDKILRDWVQGEGRLFVMLEPMVPPSIPNTLSLFKIEAHPDLVFDPGRHFVLGPHYPAPVLSTDHPITQSIHNMTPILFSARSLGLPEGEPGYTALLKTSEESWGETDLANEKPAFNQAKDKKGPLIVGVAIEKEAKPWALVVGDVDFISNSLLQAPGNQDLALNMIGWLVGDKDQVTIRPITPQFRNLTVTDDKAKWIAYTTQAVYPLIVLLSGGYFWYRRKNA